MRRGDARSLPRSGGLSGAARHSLLPAIQTDRRLPRRCRAIRRRGLTSLVLCLTNTISAYLAELWRLSPGSGAIHG